LQPLIDGTAPANYPPALGAALSVALAAEKNLRCTVMMPYGDGLERFAMWYRQLWAESLGKDGKGTTPIRALGPVDQHSQLQLYLAGAKDKMFTLLRPPQAGFGPRMKLAPGAGESLDYLEGRYVGDLVDAEARATAATLAHNGRPVRQFILNPLSEEVMGALFMHFMLETILAAALLKVDAFDQPAVEEGKVLAQRYLSEMEP
jgi:glucose-6-phosphate isomerase